MQTLTEATNESVTAYHALLNGKNGTKVTWHNGTSPCYNNTCVPYRTKPHLAPHRSRCTATQRTAGIRTAPSLSPSHPNDALAVWLSGCLAVWLCRVSRRVSYDRICSCIGGCFTQIKRLYQACIDSPRPDILRYTSKPFEVRTQDGRETLSFKHKVVFC